MWGLHRKAKAVLVTPRLTPRQAGIDGEKEHSSAKKILLEMGEFFQVQVRRRKALALLLPCPGASSPPFLLPAQDDYLDLFGDPSVTGKIGTDIQDNKCSWLVVQCLLRASPAQQQILRVLEGGLWVPSGRERRWALVLTHGTFGSISTYISSQLETVCTCYRHRVTAGGQQYGHTPYYAHRSPGHSDLAPNVNSAWVQRPWGEEAEG